MSPWDAPVGWLIVILSLAAVVLGFAFRNRPGVRELIGLDAIRAEIAGPAPKPEPEPEPVPEPHAVLSVAVWCVPCRNLLAFCCAAHAFEHLHAHKTDFAQWEREVAAP